MLRLRRRRREERAPAGKAANGPAVFARDTRGAATIEFAFLALFFFMTVFAILETAIVFLGELTLDQAVESVGRDIRTGEIRTSKNKDESGASGWTGLTKEEFRDEICERIVFLIDCEEMMIDLQTYDSFADVPFQAPIKDGDVDTSGFTRESGDPMDIVLLRVFYKWPVVTDLMRKYLSDMEDGSHLIVGTAAFRNEPF